MKKRIAAMAVLSMLLLCRSVPAEDTPVAFEETGIRIDLEDVLAASSNYVDVTEIGIVSRDPFVAYLTLDYYAIDKEILNELIDHFDSYSEEMQGDIRQLTTGIRKDLADVVVTDIQDQDALIRMIFGELPEGVSIQEFGEFEPYRYYVVSKPGFDEPEDYESFTEYDMSPDEVREAYEMLRGDTETVRAAFIGQLQTAELFAPVDPEAGLPGQILSFETTDIDGNVVTSEDLFKDNQITMVNIWGTWCHNCVGEMAELVEMHTRLREKGCGIVGVEWEREPIDTMTDEIRAFLEEQGINYPNVIIPEDNEIFDQVSGFPTTFFVDSEGRILTYPISGARVDQYEVTVDQLLSGEEVDLPTDAGSIRNDAGEYRVIVYDMDGNPVEGAVIQLCDDVTCAFQLTDAEGIAVFNVEEQKVYDIHVLMAPEGCAPDEGEYKTLDTFSDVNIFLKKAS